MEWRVINAADYGRAQKRRRVFFFVYKNDTDWAKKIEKEFETLGYLKPKSMDEPILELNLYDDYIFKKGLFARQFPIKDTPKTDGKKVRHYSAWLGEETDYDNYVLNISENFTGTIWNTGIMRHRRYYTIDTEPIKEKPITLGQVRDTAKEYFVNQYGEAAYDKYVQKYWINDSDKLEKFNYLRGSKKIKRVAENGHTYIYSEGGCLRLIVLTFNT